MSSRTSVGIFLSHCAVVDVNQKCVDVAFLLHRAPAVGQICIFCQRGLFVIFLTSFWHSSSNQ